MINVHIEVEDKTLKIDTTTVAKFVSDVMYEKGIKNADITVIFGTDKLLRDLKKQFFEKDDYTDVIAFTLEENENLEGEIYISPARALENSKEYQVTFDNELSRLIFHGTLHLIGYDDTTPDLKAEMCALEDHYLNRMNTHQLIKS